MIQNRLLLVALVLAGCGGATDKPAEDATSESGKSASSDTCPAGETKEGGECVPTGGGSGSSGSSGSSSSSTSASSTSGESAGPKTPYDKDNVDMVLNRAAMQVKRNCGAATDDSGKANGPFGQTKVSVTLGRNGHVHGVTIPDPYDGTPTGKCAVLSFKGLIFPPYAAPADVTVEWDVDIEKPGKRAITISSSWEGDLPAKKAPRRPRTSASASR